MSLSALTSSLTELTLSPHLVPARLLRLPCAISPSHTMPLFSRPSLAQFNLLGSALFCASPRMRVACTLLLARTVSASAPPVESRLPTAKTTGVPGGAVKIGANGTVGGVAQVKAYTVPPQAQQNANAPRSIIANCTTDSAAGCVTSKQPDYDLLTLAVTYQLVQV